MCDSCTAPSITNAWEDERSDCQTSLCMRASWSMFFVIHFLVSIQRSTFVYKMLLVKFVALRTGMRK